MKKNERKYVLLFLLPSLIFFVVFQFVPIIWSFMLSFFEWNVRTPAIFIGLKNYSDIFSNQIFWSSFYNTTRFVLMYVPLAIIGGLILALLVNMNLKGITFFRVTYFIPVVSSWVAVSLIWKGLLNPQYGLINILLGVAGIEGPKWLYDPGWAMQGIVMASVWKDIGFTMVLLLGGLKNIDNQLYEAAQIDGAGKNQIFWKITLPMLSPNLFFCFMISMINSFQVFDQVMIMTEGGPIGSTSVIVEQIYRNAFKYSNMGYAAAISWILLTVILVFSIFQNRIEKKMVFYS